MGEPWPMIVSMVVAVSPVNGPLLTPGERRRAAVLAVLRAALEHDYVITRTKLAKLLYLADLRAVAAGGEPISGIRWKWLNFGPFNNDLLEIEQQLVQDELVTSVREPWEFGQAYRLSLVGDPAALPRLAPGEEAVLAAAVREWGSLAASSLKDLSYQTPPMIEAQAEGNRGVVLDLNLVRPRPKVSRTLARIRAAIRARPEQFDDGPAPDARPRGTGESETRQGG
jgi:hypothetical protein